MLYFSGLKLGCNAIKQTKSGGGGGTAVAV